MKRRDIANLNTVRPRLAYIDGGLAAFIAQAAIAGILGVMWTMKGYWYRIKARFTGGAARPESAPPENDGPDTV